jgi:hypothetical protein
MRSYDLVKRELLAWCMLVLSLLLNGMFFLQYEAVEPNEPTAVFRPLCWTKSEDLVVMNQPLREDFKLDVIHVLVDHGISIRVDEKGPVRIPRNLLSDKDYLAEVTGQAARFGWWREEQVRTGKLVPVAPERYPHFYVFNRCDKLIHYAVSKDKEQEE